MHDSLFAPNERRPAWPMPARYAEILARLRVPVFKSVAPADPAPVATWFARLRQWLCPCCHARG